ncbi:PEP-CTERM sorting domain-containing protein [Rhodopirellula sp. MGV]|uniref:PEP-CTERM sorting domain-containing protein n=1 Tax=Rhodopirellula sp. MGV TaxID=2023130 RepID=UPI000B96760A|nr:PEP-CTERM sorting domain-containing protein [Rhodopirellula sp. MGV]OYP34437.1 hypothetical protein CGZ80_15430 [Rhodopirellula sp. MGV]PNY37387.1 PEP-CTERM sorting domain-containing protein [Rhodopirellula baltica]
MKDLQLKRIAFIAALSVCMPLHAEAAYISDLVAVLGPGTLTSAPTADTTDLNNDNFAGAGIDNGNQINFEGITITDLQPIDFVIEATNSGGTSEYFMNFGTAVNDTGVAWKGLRLELGSGTGFDFMRTTNPFPGVVGLDFDFPDTDPTVSSIDLPVVEHTADMIFFTGGVIAPGESATGQQLSLDLPDIGGLMTYNFTLRMEVVAIPEPSMVALLGGIGCVGVFRRRR